VHAEAFEEVEVGLAGSPYLIPAEQTEYVEETFLPMVEAIHYRAETARRKISATRLRSIGSISRTSEIYESNKIEGLGPDLATTQRVLKNYSLDRSVGVSVARNAIQRCIDAEPKVRDVVGLGAAKVLAEAFIEDTARPLTEADVRQLHELIMVGDTQGGSYKRYINSIVGSTHVPSNPSDTPLHMRDLMAWLNGTSLSPLWKATVVHAWLTHIHPFHDGNGRIARLLANLVLIRASLPPLIVRASGDRGRYLDALNASDAGDILPLARVFRQIVQRSVRDLEDPAFAQELFEEEVQRRYEPLFVRWQAGLVDLLDQTGSRLLLNRLELQRIGDVGNSDFARLQKGQGGNIWVAKVHVRGKQQDLLLHVASPTAASGRHLEEDESIASIFVSVRNQQPLAARQYLMVGHESPAFEFTPIVDSGTVLVRVHGDARRLSTADASELVANQLARIAGQLIVR
jgi:Fic family protein